VKSDKRLKLQVNIRLTPQQLRELDELALDWDMERGELVVRLVALARAGAMSA
jgi:hypothetical protein